MICEVCEEGMQHEIGYVKITEAYDTEKYVYIFCSYNCLRHFFGWVDAK